MPILSIDYGNCFHDDNLPAHFEAYSTCENAIFSEKQFDITPLL